MAVSTLLYTTVVNGLVYCVHFGSSFRMEETLPSSLLRLQYPHHHKHDLLFFPFVTPFDNSRLCRLEAHHQTPQPTSHIRIEEIPHFRFYFQLKEWYGM